MKNLIQPLQVYDRLTEQDRFKENLDGTYKFLSNRDKLIPFQFIVPIGATTINSFSIKGTYNYDFVLANNVGKFGLYSNGNQKNFMYFGEQLNHTNVMSVVSPLILAGGGYHWFEVVVDGKTYYTEMFYVVGDGFCDKPITLEIEAWDRYDTNGHLFSNNFRYKCFFDSFITDQTPNIQEEFSKDGFERNNILRRVIQFLYNFELDPLPNSIAVGITALTAFTNFVIKHNGNTYTNADLTVKPERIDGGGLYSLLFSFTLPQEDLIKTACNIPAQSPLFYKVVTQMFQRNNCIEGQVGTSVQFSKTYTSTIDQDDADNKATLDAANFAIQGQDFANDPINGATCGVPELRPLTWSMTENETPYVDNNLQGKKNNPDTVIIDAFGNDNGVVNVEVGKSVTLQTYSIYDPETSPSQTAYIKMIISKNDVEFYNQQIVSSAGASLICPPFIIESGASYSVISNTVIIEGI